MLFKEKEAEKTENMIERINLALFKIRQIKTKRFEVKEKELLLSIHVLALTNAIAHFMYALLLLLTARDEFLQDPLIKHTLGYWPVLLTLWGLILSKLSFFTCILAEIIDVCSIKSLKKWEDSLHYISNYTLFAFAFPLSLLAGLVFWIFYFYDYKAIYPDIAHLVLTPYLNHVAHTFSPFMTVLFMGSPNKKPSKLSTLVGLETVLIFYGTCITLIKIWHGKWVYLAFEVLSPLQMTFFFASSVIGVAMFHHLGYAINEFVISLRHSSMWKHFTNRLYISIPVAANNHHCKQSKKLGEDNCPKNK